MGIGYLGNASYGEEWEGYGKNENRKDPINWIKDENSNVTGIHFDSEQHFRKQVDETKLDPEFKKRFEEHLKELHGEDCVPPNVVEMINNVKKEKIVIQKPELVNELESLNLYSSYITTNDRFECFYLDFVEEEKNLWLKTGEEVEIKEGIKGERLKETPVKTIGLKMFTKTGLLQEQFIDLVDKDLKKGVKDFINDQFIEKLKELSLLHKTKSKRINIDFDLKSTLNMSRITSELMNRINMIDTLIHIDTRRGGASFIIASEENSQLILKFILGYTNSDGKLRKLNGNTNTKFDILSYDELGDTVIVGRKPKEGEPGINLVINKDTIGNFVYSDDDITGINMKFGFFDFGAHPEDMYFQFDLKK
jgi:hypothetical protein